MNENDANDANEKRDTLTQKLGVMASKNEISLLRPAINEWRPKKNTAGPLITGILII